MKTENNEITVSVTLNGSEVSRNYVFGGLSDIEPMTWAVAVTEMLTTLSNEDKPM